MLRKLIALAVTAVVVPSDAHRPLFVGREKVVTVSDVSVSWVVYGEVCPSAPVQIAGLAPYVGTEVYAELFAPSRSSKQKRQAINATAQQMQPQALAHSPKPEGHRMMEPFTMTGIEHRGSPISGQYTTVPFEIVSVTVTSTECAKYALAIGTKEVFGVEDARYFASWAIQARAWTGFPVFWWLFFVLYIIHIAIGCSLAPGQVCLKEQPLAWWRWTRLIFILGALSAVATSALDGGLFQPIGQRAGSHADGWGWASWYIISYWVVGVGLYAWILLAVLKESVCVKGCDENNWWRLHAILAAFFAWITLDPGLTFGTSLVGAFLIAAVTVPTKL